jgi:hypothetical protein
VIQAQKNSQVFYGSEFHPVSILSRLLDQHPLWKYTYAILCSGAPYRLKPIPTDICLEDIYFPQDRGGHKSASKFHDKITSIIQEDFEKRFALPLPIKIFPLIPNASVASLGCHKQMTINALGDHVPKFRLTHGNLSLPIKNFC